jgi:hypothetical protein
MPARITVVFICNDAPLKGWVFAPQGGLKGEEHTSSRLKEFVSTVTILASTEALS